jgi:phosphoesterase RecJ-like protein
MSSSDIQSNTSLSGIADALKSAESIVILSHLRPDGDAIGSQVGLGLALKAAGKCVRCLNEDGVPESLAFLPGIDLVETPETAAPLDGVDLVVACDTADQKRLGERVREMLPKGVVLVNVDHHVSNARYGDLYYVDSISPATGQIIYQLLEAGRFPISSEVSENLFIAISTDTGSFQYPNTTADTFRTGASLIDAGAGVGQLSQSMYDNYPLRRLKLLGELLEVMEIGNRGRRASWAMTLEMAERLEIQASDTDGLIDHLRSIQGVLVAAFFQEAPGGYVRASLRSKDPAVDVCKVCQRFNGGGHALAAGVRMKSPLAAAQEQVLDAIDEAIDGIH